MSAALKGRAAKAYKNLAYLKFAATVDKEGSRPWMDFMTIMVPY